MSTVNSWCGRFCISSFALIITIFILDYKACVLPLNGIWLALYMFLIIVSTVWISCTLIQRLLQQNQVIEFDFESNRYLKLFKNVCEILHLPINFDFISVQKVSNHAGSDTPKNINKITDVIDSLPILKTKANSTPFKNIDDRIEEFANDIEERFISKWYKHISDDETFSVESKVLLEGIVRRVLQVSVLVDGDKIICGTLVILLKHLKEYRKAVKRAHKNGSSVESAYRYAHVATKSDAAFEYYTHRLTGNVLREFISWELWNSLPSRLLVSVLSKRLTSYIIRYISQPAWINYRLISMCVSEKVATQLNLSNYAYISLFDVNLTNEKIEKAKTEGKIDIENKKIDGSTPQLTPKKEISPFPESDLENSNINSMIQTDSDSMIEQALTKMISQHTAPILPRAEKNLQDKEITTPPITAKNTPEHKQQDFSPKRSEPVKIHSAKSSKHWDDSDVGNISVGQDLLAMEAIDNTEIQGFSGRRLWGPSLGNNVDKQSHPLWDINEIFKDKDSFESDDKVKEESKSSPKTRDKKGNLTASTVHNMRELQQSTVNNVVKPVSNATEKAIHKIGDLQDEAVGVVEGIFDFGMAGIRKGLRLTGLQDSEPQKSKQSLTNQLQHQKSVEKSPKNAPKLVKVGHIASEDIKKQSQESIDSSIWINPLARESPTGFENQMLFEKSPNIESPPEKVVSETNINIPNISTEINQFLSEETPEYEETADLASTISKLRSLLQQKSSESSLNTPAASPMPVEDKSCSTPTEPVIADAIRNDGGMQRFARTVTGMFNTFKGALPGNAEQCQAKSDHWIYVENELSETDLPSLLNSLLIERRDYCTIDTAYEAMDSLDLLTESVASPIKKIEWDNQTFEDELDDFDGSIPISKALLDVLCECFLETNCALKQEPVIKSILVIAGKKIEDIMSAVAFKMIRYLNKSIGPLPKNDNELPMALELNKMVKLLEEALPGVVKNIFGEKDTKAAIEFFISSLQSPKINQDITLQFFELICSQLIFASSQMSPTPSA